MGNDGVDNLRPMRILVIDDVACCGKSGVSAGCIQAAIWNHFTSLLGGTRRSLCIDFVGTPEMGVKKWKSEIYDLALVDSDFQKSSSAKKDDERKLSFLDLEVEFMGAYLCRFLHEMLARDQKKDGEMLSRDQEKDGAHFRTGCKVVLWTGLTCKDAAPDKESEKRDRARRIFDVLGLTSESDPASSILFVPKDRGNVDLWRSLLAGNKSTDDKNAGACVTTIEKVFADLALLDSCEKGNARSWLARAITWYKTMTPCEFARTAGLNEPCVEGYLSWQDGVKTAGEFKILTEKPNGNDWVYLSPSLRTRTGFADCIGKLPVSDSVLPPQQDEFRFPEACVESSSRDVPVVAAATPLTGCSVVGRDRALAVMEQKIDALLAKAFDRVVLKTVYLDALAKVDCKWPTLQIQSVHRARCYRSADHLRTIWNTGTTAQETFSPKMMNEFLKAYRKKPTAGRVIVSLGSKFPDGEQRKHIAADQFEGELKRVWKALFDAVFRGLGPDPYADVEINVRHYLRGCIEAHLGGDEYLSPTNVDAGEPVFGSYGAVDKEFSSWLSVVNEVALEHGKKLHLKMPLRGDLIHFIELVGNFKETHEGNAIEGLVFVNAFKSALREPARPVPYSPAWYGSTRSWDDRKNDDVHGSPLSMRCQVSGELLQLSRNQLLFAVERAAEKAGLKLQVGGGVVDRRDLLFCGHFPSSAGVESSRRNAVQIGTWGLMSLRLDGYMGACESLVIDAPKGGGNADASGLALQPKRDGLHYRIAYCLHELCNGCGKCSRSFYCDTFQDRRGHDLSPVMDVRNCTGCGLCAQICPAGAIQLFRPEGVVVLIAKSEGLQMWRRRLNAYEIPNLWYDADQILALVRESRGMAVRDPLEAWGMLCDSEALHLAGCLVLSVENRNGKEVLRGCRTSAGTPWVDLSWKDGCLEGGKPARDWLAEIKYEVKQRLDARRG